MSLTTHGEDQFNIGQISIEINEASPQFSDLQTKENYSNHEEHEFHKTYNLQERHQGDYISPYVRFISNFDERDEDDEQIFCNNLGSTADSKDNPQFSNLQTKEDFISYEEEGEKQKFSDQQLRLFFHLTEEEQSTFSIDISEKKSSSFSFSWNNSKGRYLFVDLLTLLLIICNL